MRAGQKGRAHPCSTPVRNLRARLSHSGHLVPVCQWLWKPHIYWFGFPKAFQWGSESANTESTNDEDQPYLPFRVLRKICSNTGKEHTTGPGTWQEPVIISSKPRHIYFKQLCWAKCSIHRALEQALIWGSRQATYMWMYTYHLVSMKMLYSIVHSHLQDYEAKPLFSFFNKYFLLSWKVRNPL